MSWSELRARLDADPEYQALIDEEYPFEEPAMAIVRLRADHGLTQEELARRIGTSQSAIARAESGRQAVGAKLLNRIAQAVGMNWRPEFFNRESADSVLPLAAAAYGYALEMVDVVIASPQATAAHAATTFHVRVPNLNAHDTNLVYSSLSTDLLSVSKIAEEFATYGSRPKADAEEPEKQTVATAA
jgi:transcriptional regulator with XRE-family HTH domain